MIEKKNRTVLTNKLLLRFYLNVSIWKLFETQSKDTPEATIMLQLFLISPGVDPWTTPTVGHLDPLLITVCYIFPTKRQAKRAVCKNLRKNNSAYSSLSIICEFILGPIRDVYYSGILTGLANTPEKFMYAHFPGNLVQQPGSGCYTCVS
jgi:hypothetical protein